jgi:hypothetical protein
MSEESVVEVEVVETSVEEMPTGDAEVVDAAAVHGKTEEVQEGEEGASTESGKKDEAGKKASGKLTSDSLRDAWKQVESFGQALSEALQGRGNVVMVRVNDEALEHLDMLVEAEITKSRSESAAFLINEGINANQDLFERIGTITQQIAELREQLRVEVHEELKAEEAAEEESA